MIKRIGHTAYYVKDMNKSLTFYCNILGFEKAFELHKENGEPWIVYIKVAERQSIELFYDGQEGSNKVDRAVGYHHLCLEVNDIDQIAQHVKAKGLSLESGPKKGIDGNYQCWIKDPDGNPIEFMQLIPGSPHVNN
ncbi:VOC family protein [Gracilibacillus xinjiangensis]|uniref:VOC family protein n=1 Tax=Gracilibacillus xinjiangensis TaxID=1193282 RepID=A0ABV8WUB0_9BACI